MYRPLTTLQEDSNKKLIDSQCYAMLNVARSHFDYILRDESVDGDGEYLKNILIYKMKKAIRLSNEDSEVSPKMKEVLLPIAREYGLAGLMGAKAAD